MLTYASSSTIAILPHDHGLPGRAQEFRGDQQNAAEVSQWALARAQALSEQAGLRVAWMRGQVGPHMSTAERLTLAEAVAAQVSS